MKILLYVTGSISCYKSFDITRELVKLGHEVKVTLSAGAEKFLKKDLFQYLGVSECYSSKDDFLHHSNILHTALASWCDLFIVCPMSANTLGHLASGLTKDLGTTTFLALPEKTPVLIFPAMNTKMLNHPITSKNIARLKECLNIHFFPTKTGILACGEEGAGKLLDTSEVLELINSWL